MPKKLLNGIVVSDKPNKTITVVVERKYQHPVLKKVIKSKKKYNVHDENNKFRCQALLWFCRVALIDHSFLSLLSLAVAPFASSVV